MAVGENRHRGRFAIAGAIAVAILMLWFSAWTGGREIRLRDWPLDLVSTFGTAALFALAWLGSAVGYGWWLRLWLARNEGGVIQFGLGVAALLFIDAALGAAGALQWGYGVVAWGVLAVGWISLIVQLIKAHRYGRGDLTPLLPHSFFWLSAPAIAVLLIAACSAPGWLWETEFGGYDALSYHLQLPKEWMSLGSITPLEHNVYSFLPGYVEAAYYHLANLRGNAIESAYAAQMMHAFITIGAALATGRLVTRCTASEAAGAIAAVIVLGTPWTIVVGSLAYNEMFVLLFLACALGLVISDAGCVRKRAFAIGILAGSAIGAKLTAIGFVVAPLAIAVIALHPPRRWITTGVVAATACVVILLPYLIRNGLAVGNPVFPFATQFFGEAHWTREQVEVWNRGHRSEQSFIARPSEAWNQLLRFGLGDAPGPDEPWEPQWSLLWWIGPIAAIAALLRGPYRRLTRSLLALLAVQTVFWLLFTHLQSRFLVPAVIPLAVLTSLGFWSLAIQNDNRSTRPWLVSVFALILTLWSLQPVQSFRSENDGAPAARIGSTAFMTGGIYKQLLDSAADETDRRTILESAEPAFVINFALLRDSKTLLVGDAAPFYYVGGHSYQTTWDRGPLSETLRQTDDATEVFARLRAAGYTYILINFAMLERWAEAGWNDPLLTPQNILRLFDGNAPLIQAWENGAIRLYEIPRE